jgi:S-formylglutathione hydrolase FrmB
VLPQRTEDQIGVEQTMREGPPPVLYLLHGLTDDHTAWPRYTSIGRYAEAAGLAVVMPSVHHSFYADEVHGHRYWTFVSEELPAVVSSFFRVSAEPSDTFVAGLSMGGYGALKWALRQPERFAAAASLSGAVDVERLRAVRIRTEVPPLFDRVFGDEPVAGTADDLWWLLEQRDPATLPALWVGCGTGDPLYSFNEEFVAAGVARGIAVTSSFVPGEHEWGLWDRQIQQVLDWLPLDSG